MFVGDKVKSEPGLGVSSPGKALATILPDAPLLPLQRYLTAAQWSDTDHNLQIGSVKRPVRYMFRLKCSRAQSLPLEERPERTRLALPAREGETMAGWKGRRRLASRWRNPYLHTVVLPEGRILLELEPRRRGGAAAAAELVVGAVRMHRGCAGARGGLPVPGQGGRGDGGEGESEMQWRRGQQSRWGFGLKWGAEAARRFGWPISNLGSRPAQLELCPHPVPVSV